jgi:hypothetical protein
MPSGHVNRAPTNPACVKKVFADSEPSTHGTRRDLRADMAHVRDAEHGAEY